MYVKFIGEMKEGKGQITHTVEGKEVTVKHFKDGTKRVAIRNDKGGESHYFLTDGVDDYVTAFVMNDRGDTIERISVHRMTADTLWSKPDNDKKA